MLKKIKNLFNQIVNQFREDLPSHYFQMNKIEYYFPKTYNNSLSYVVKYSSIESNIYWGPFSSMQSANDFSSKIQELYNVNCDLIVSQSPHSDPKNWFI
jgi:hypothetical protein